MNREIRTIKIARQIRIIYYMNSVLIVVRDLNVGQDRHRVHHVKAQVHQDLAQP